MKLTFIIADELANRMRLQYENEFFPYRKRTVSIELTQEQIEQIGIKEVGIFEGTKVWEVIHEVWVEE